MVECPSVAPNHNGMVRQRSRGSGNCNTYPNHNGKTRLRHIGMRAAFCHPARGPSEAQARPPVLPFRSGDKTPGHPEHVQIPCCRMIKISPDRRHRARILGRPFEELVILHACMQQLGPDSLDCPNTGSKSLDRPLQNSQSGISTENFVDTLSAFHQARDSRSPLVFTSAYASMSANDEESKVASARVTDGNLGVLQDDLGCA